MNEKRILSLIGLAAKAGRIVSGEFASEKSVRTGRARMVILAGDSSGNTKKKFRNMCASHQVPLMEVSDKDTLGKVIGRQQRSSIALEDDGFAEAIGRLGPA